VKHINPERGHLWVEALRSDEYQQAQGAFVQKTDEGVVEHCCLAVATDVAMKHGLDSLRWGKDPVDGQPVLLFDYDPAEHGNIEDQSHQVDEDGHLWVEHHDGDLPQVVADWYGIKGGSRFSEEVESAATNPMIDGATAINRNDERKDSFLVIADAVEAEIRKVQP
jgi:hypothetical protein